jgi:hypothetical protein
VAFICKINPTDRARAGCRRRPRHALNRAAIEQEERYVPCSCWYAEPRDVSHPVSKDRDAVTEFLPDDIARAA